MARQKINYLARLKDLLKERTKDNIKNLDESELRQIYNTYRKLTPSQKTRNKRLSELSKLAEATRQGKKRARTGEVKESKYKSDVSDLSDAIKSLKSKMSQISALRHQIAKANKVGEDDKQFYKRVLLKEQELAMMLEESIKKTNDKYSIMKAIALYRGMDSKNKEVLSKDFREMLGGGVKQQEDWLETVYDKNATEYNHLDRAKGNAKEIYNGLKEMSGMYEEMSDSLKKEYEKFIDSIVSLTMVEIQYEMWVSSEGIQEVRDNIRPYQEDLNQIYKNGELEAYDGITENYKNEALVKLFDIQE